MNQIWNIKDTFEKVLLEYATWIQGSVPGRQTPRSHSLLSERSRWNTRHVAPEETAARGWDSAVEMQLATADACPPAALMLRLANTPFLKQKQCRTLLTTAISAQWRKQKMLLRNWDKNIVLKSNDWCVHIYYLIHYKRGPEGWT